MKLKYFFDKFVWNLNPGKTFIYFTAATIGGKFLRNILYQQGVKEFGAPNLSNFVCVICLKKRKCDICTPMSYIMITSKYETKIDDKHDLIELLNKSNESNNDDGQVIKFIFGSKKISESYTLKEIKNIVYLTVPTTNGELSQSLGRASRVFSHKNILNAKINIYLLIADTGEANIENLFKKNDNNINYIFDIESLTISNKKQQTFFEDLISTNNKKISFDLRKLIYLELKSENNIEILNKLKNCHLDYTSNVNENVKKLYMVELVKRISYSNIIFKIDKLISSSDNLIEKEDIYKIFNEFKMSSTVRDVIYEGKKSERTEHL